jgi:hypothetical protein
MFACAVCTASPGAAEVQNETRCLFATTVGEERLAVGSCTALDPLQLGRNEQVKKVMAAINAVPGSITFRGCPGDVYAVRATSGTSYVVTYPPQVTQGFIAPVTHELSHIVQIRAAGGMAPLAQRYRSRRIELGADFLAGVLFRRVLPEVSRNEFQNHARLNGLYREQAERAHGTPVQRTSAFRIGVVGLNETPGMTLAQASEWFQEDLYASIMVND